jgi:hypothetical protein
MSRLDPRPKPRGRTPERTKLQDLIESARSEGISASEIARALGRSTGAIKALSARARRAEEDIQRQDHWQDHRQDQR